MSPIIRKLLQLKSELGSIEACDLLEDAIKAEERWEQSNRDCDDREPQTLGREADFIMTQYEKRVNRNH